MEEVSIGRVQAYRMTEVLNCTLIVPAAVPSDAPVVVSIAVVGVHQQGLAVVPHSLLIVPNLRQAAPTSLLQPQGIQHMVQDLPTVRLETTQKSQKPTFDDTTHIMSVVLSFELQLRSSSAQFISSMVISHSEADNFRRQAHRRYSMSDC